MDPAETLRLIAVLITDGELDDAQELSNAYTEWRQRGGFQPPGGDAKLRKLNARLEKAISKAFAKGFRPEVQLEPFTRHPADVRYENKSRARKIRTASKKRTPAPLVLDRSKVFQLGDFVKPSAALVATGWSLEGGGGRLGSSPAVKRAAQARMRKLRGTVVQIGDTYGDLTSYTVRWTDGRTTAHNQTMFDHARKRG
jgi:hypothetical protein